MRHSSPCVARERVRCLRAGSLIGLCTRREKKRRRAEAREHERAAAAAGGDLASGLTPEDIQQMMACGIPFGFASSAGTYVEDEACHASAVQVKTTRKARQYMNRKGGFNRPLPAEKTGQKMNEV